MCWAPAGKSQEKPGSWKRLRAPGSPCKIQERREGKTWNSRGKILGILSNSRGSLIPELSQIPLFSMDPAPIPIPHPRKTGKPFSQGIPDPGRFRSGALPSPGLHPGIHPSSRNSRARMRSRNSIPTQKLGIPTGMSFPGFPRVKPAGTPCGSSPGIPFPG